MKEIRSQIRKKILDIQQNFYHKLYSQSGHHTLNEYNIYLQKTVLPTITEETKAICDANITHNEIKTAIKELHNNKTPGPDGLPVEFYKLFCDDILDLLSASFENSFENGLLSVSQRQGVLCLIPKKGKDLTKIESWRPLSILNTDYKILTKILGTRLKLALPELVNPDQIGYMSKRYYGENIRLINDIIDYCQIEKISSAILLIDFEKAFDTICWDFLKCCMDQYGFGFNFKKWIAIIYNKIESCVTNNGYQSEYFQLSRGIRQGCPLSALLFLLATEVVAVILRNLDCIQGIKVKET